MSLDIFEEARRILSGIVHPESGRNIVESGIVAGISGERDTLAVTLAFPRNRDPLAKSIIRQVQNALEAAFPDISVRVETREETPKKSEGQEPAPSGMAKVKKVIAVSSAKGGVGKSTVTANLAVTLAGMGYRVGVLDADIYGPSLPKMFGAEDHQPEAEKVGPHEVFLPVEAHGVRLMSIGFFINPADALVWRGPMATNALRQLIHQTAWGELDVLLIDMPPGTGDVHLTILGEMKVDGAVIVSTPQQVALADVLRGIRMFRSPAIDVPVLGIIENMAWFTPAELPGSRYYIFGRDGVEKLAESEGVPVLGEIPLIMSIWEGADAGTPGAGISQEAAGYYKAIADKIVEKTGFSVNNPDR